MKKFKVSVKNRNEFNDYDYLNKLTKEEYDWLRRFQREYLNADFQHGGDILHSSDKLRKDCFNQNNSRNRDTYAYAKVRNSLFNIQDYGVSMILDNPKRITLEDVWIEILDRKNNGTLFNR